MNASPATTRPRTRRTVTGDAVFDVRIVEEYGRRRVCAEFRRVTKREALIMLGAARHASLAIGGDRTWVSPAIYVNRGDGWHKQRHEVWRRAGQAFVHHQEFWLRDREPTTPTTTRSTS